MHTAYILSQYPARSETFIAREMQELVRRGNDLTIARLRWSDTGSGMQVKGASVLRLHWTPVDWILGLGWGIAEAPRVLLKMGRDIATTSPISSLWWRLLVLALVTLSLARTLHHRSPEHLRAHLLDSESVAAHWLGTLLGVPYSVTVHTRATRLPSSLLHRVVADASFCATISRETKRMVESLPISSCPTHLIRNGVRMPDVPLRPAHSRFRWRLLAIGRLVEKKGFDTLLEACALLRAWLHPARCTIVGDGPCLSSLRTQVNHLDLAPHVQLCGPLPNDQVLRAFRHHDILVMPSRPTAEGERDGIPTVLIEAMAHSTVVVASDFAGIPELVHDGLTGRLVPPESPVALARTLSSLSNRPAERDYMRRQGRKRILRDYNLEREVGKLQALMRSVKP